MASVAAVLTVFYSVRLIYVVFLDSYSGFKLSVITHSKVTNLEILILGFLGILSMSTGYFFKDLFLGLGSAYFNNSILLLPTT
jgi:NADH:ubiquinone oxidoreductase subunit 5 (subunit L)/multisubunit Na+/H+ antiporter MnhA subunit